MPAIPTIAAQVVLLGVVAVLVVSYVRTRLWRCPDCEIGNGADGLLEYGHIATTIEDDPYCPYCGEQTEFAGRRYEFWSDAIRSRVPGGDST